MRIPEKLATLADYGIVQEVVRPLMSGKEAEVYLVVSGGAYRVAKIYKDAAHRSFKNRSEYTEGRQVRNSRDQRAMTKRSARGRAQEEEAWRSAEADIIHRLHAVGVRVPVPHHFIDGVLVMELILDAFGHPAPRLGDVVLSPDEAVAIHGLLLREVVRMLCAGVVHGDLSEFNVLLGRDGPVVIDFPQSVDPARNQNARKLLLRDVGNLHTYVSRFARGFPRRPYAEEMWDLYQANLLSPDTTLTGVYRPQTRRGDSISVESLINDANRDEQRRRASLGLKPGALAPKLVEPAPPPVSKYAEKKAAALRKAVEEARSRPLAPGPTREPTPPAGPGRRGSSNAVATRPANPRGGTPGPRGSQPQRGQPARPPGGPPADAPVGPAPVERARRRRRRKPRSADKRSTS